MNADAKKLLVGVGSAVLVTVVAVAITVGNRGARPSDRAYAPILDCDEVKRVGQASFSLIVAPEIVEEKCRAEGERAVYEAWVQPRGMTDRPAHFKVTFRSWIPRDGVYEFCTDALPRRGRVAWRRERTGTWFCWQP